MEKLNFHPRPTWLALAMLAAPLAHAQEVNPGMYMGIGIGESRANIDNARITQGLLGAGLTTTSLTEDRRDTAYKAKTASDKASERVEGWCMAELLWNDQCLAPAKGNTPLTGQVQSA